MLADRNKFTNFAYLIIACIGIGTLGYLAYGWSLGETRKFADIIFDGTMAAAFAWFVQLAPQISILSGRLLTHKHKHAKTFSYALAIVFNLLDCWTNFGAFTILMTTPGNFSQGLHPSIMAIAEPLGYAVAFGVTWAEELMILWAGSAFEMAKTLWPTGRRQARPAGAGGD